MKLALVGVGGAGGRIVDRIVGMEKDTDRSLCHGNVLAFDLAGSDGSRFEHVPRDRHVVIGGPDRNGTPGGIADPDRAVGVARENVNVVRRAFDDIRIHEMDGTLVVAGLGGCTGAGVGAVVVDELESMYDEPVYALGVLPGGSEGERPTLNAARSLQSFVRRVDNFIAFDNEAWDVNDHAAGRAPEERYEEVNRELATRIVTLLAAGELDTATVAENAIDSSDIMRTLATGGVSSVGYASTGIESDGGGVLSRLLPWFYDGSEEPDDGTTDAKRIKGLVRRAVGARLTLPCEVSSAERALILLSGPPETFSRRGFESARRWLEREADTVEVLAGDDPRRDSSTLAAAVLLSNVTDVPRIDALQARAVEVGTSAAERAAFRDGPATRDGSATRDEPAIRDESTSGEESSSDDEPVSPEERDWPW